MSLMAYAGYRLGIASGWVELFLAAMALDYISGILAAVVCGELSSRIGIRGIMKKLGGCVVIAVAVIVDEILTKAAYFGIGENFSGMLASVVVLWLILNELISILENLGRANVPLPPFLKKAIAQLRKKSEGIIPDQPEE